jgi:hypothetical protein
VVVEFLTSAIGDAWVLEMGFRTRRKLITLSRKHPLYWKLL